MITVLRVRCTQCEKTFTVVTKEPKKVTEGQSLKISCKDIQPFYKAAKGCTKKLVYIRTQGRRELSAKHDVVLEEIKNVVERTKRRSRKTRRS